MDFGINDWATLDDGPTIENPRSVKAELPHLAHLHRQRAKKREGSIRQRRLSCLIAKTHERIGNLRREFIHQQTSRLVSQCELLATEGVKVKNMSRSAAGTVDKPASGLNRNQGSIGSCSRWAFR